MNLLSGNAVRLTFRSSHDGRSSYDVIVDAMDNVFKISERLPHQVLDSFPVTVQLNHPCRIREVAAGNMIEAWLDGVKRLEVTKSTYSSGQLGQMLFVGAASYDDLVAGKIP